MRVLVTGATGFVGPWVCTALVDAAHSVRVALWTDTDEAPPDRVVVGNIGADTDWTHALEGIEAVIHLAGRAHIMHDQAADLLAAYRQVNVDGTTQLASQAATAGVRRLVYVSSVKVNGEETPEERPFSEADPPAPLDAYGISKREAEQQLREIARETALEVAIVRPVLVYGPNAKGNLHRLLGLIDRGIPLPLGRVRNRRSLIGVENLADLLVACVTHPRAAGETFLASDGHDLSTAELIRALAAGLGRSARLLPVPVALMQAAGRLLGREELIRRLCGSLVVDSRKARKVLGWSPRRSVADGLAETARAYRDAGRG